LHPGIELLGDGCGQRGFRLRRQRQILEAERVSTQAGQTLLQRRTVGGQQTLTPPLGAAHQHADALRLERSERQHTTGGELLGARDRGFR
jgi:hypothetical protein